MGRIEKTVFISYRRANAPWALAIYQYLNQRGYDVFFDFNGIASGDFERVILQNISARAHFLVLLTPSALERCSDASDLFRLEIETALNRERNIIPLMLEGFDFRSPAVDRQLTGQLELLKRYNAIGIPTEYFLEAMKRLCDKFLNVPLEAVLHPVSIDAQQATVDQKLAASEASVVTQDELTAQQWFERAFSASTAVEKIHFYDEAIRLDPTFAVAFNNRGVERETTSDLVGALEDYNQAIQLDPTLYTAFLNRANAYGRQDNLAAAIADYDEVVRLKSDHAAAFNLRGVLRYRSGDLAGANSDFSEALRLDPNLDIAIQNRALTRVKAKDYTGSLRDSMSSFVAGFKKGLKSENK